MWDRVTLKAKGKVAFTNNYWRCVFVAFILMLFVNGGIASNFNTTYNHDSEYYYDASSYKYTSEFLLDSPFYLALGLPILLGLGIAAILLDIFVFSMLEIGGCRFFVRNADNFADVGDLVYAFKNGAYGSMVKTQFFRGLYTVLWACLLVIPGIIKSYEYCMIPYLLAENPDMEMQEAFQVSKDMMMGNKWDVFVLDLSFIGWELLSLCTVGIVGIFFVNPYQNATKAELYLVLKEDYTRQKFWQ